ncbi:hypothetical protein OC845_001508 [Tilletia horrida]|nr:hypothetical protein OC845_001508 [Tilletia horrida]
MKKQQQRIATLQLNPVRVGDVQANIQFIRDVLFSSAGTLRSLDLLVLPEMITTGYRFSRSADIHSLCEDTRDASLAPSLTFASEVAQHFHSYVIIGFAEKATVPVTFTSNNGNISISPPFDARSPLDLSSTSSSTSHENAFYNSAALFDRSGALIHTFRKHFLYEDDKVWAQEGPGLQYVDLPDLGRLCVAICMDLNPYEFIAPFQAYELANFCRSHSVDILAMPMAWLLSKEQAENGEVEEGDESSNAPPGEQDDSSPDINTISYWAIRCQPFRSLPRRTILIAANRTGSEGDATFAGSSCIMQFGRAPPNPAELPDSQQGKDLDSDAFPPPTVLSSLGVRQRGVQVVTV